MVALCILCMQSERCCSDPVPIFGHFSVAAVQNPLPLRERPPDQRAMANIGRQRELVHSVAALPDLLQTVATQISTPDNT